MIWESAPYKEELQKLAKDFVSWEKRKRLNSADFVRIEMTTFSSAYLIRKLLDAGKLTDRTRDSRVRVKMSKNIKNVTRLNWHRIEELYDFSLSHSEEITIRDLCNQLIHSYVFVVALNKSGGLDALYFAADKQRNKALCRIQTKALATVLRLVGRDNPGRSEWRFNVQKGDFEMSVS